MERTYSLLEEQECTDSEYMHGTMYEYTYTIMAAAGSDTACHVWGGIGDPEQEPTTLQSH